MYYKWLANHATFDFEHGGDVSFDANIGYNVHMGASGDAEGNPRKQTGRVEKDQGKVLHVYTRMENKLYVHLEYNRRRTLSFEAFRSNLYH